MLVLIGVVFVTLVLLFAKRRNDIFQEQTFFFKSIIQCLQGSDVFDLEKSINQIIQDRQSESTTVLRVYSTALDGTDTITVTWRSSREAPQFQENLVVKIYVNYIDRNGEFIVVNTPGGSNRYAVGQRKTAYWHVLELVTTHINSYSKPLVVESEPKLVTE